MATVHPANPLNPRNRYMILDACCVLNFLASNTITSILNSLPQSIAIAEYVYTEEVLPVQASLFGNPDQVTVLQRQIDSGLLQIISLDSEREEKLLVNLAASMDDGEAYTCAIALCRQWDIASDDHKVLSVIKKIAPQMRVVTTPELLKIWADDRQIATSNLSIVLENIQRRANYWPGPKHPLYSWWQANINLK